MRYSDVFPSKYVKAADLQGRHVQVKISRVEVEAVGNEQRAKPVAYFENRQKGLVLNKTNCIAIGDAYGDDMDAWIGKSITLFATKVSFNNQMVDSVRVTVPSSARSAAAPSASRPAAAELDDAIPF